MAILNLLGQVTEPTAMDWTLPLLREFGLPILLLLLLCWAIYKGAVWCGLEVVKPLKDSHVTFLGILQDQMRVQTSTLQQIATTQQHQAELQRDNVTLLQEVSERLTEQNRILTDHHRFAVDAVFKLEKNSGQSPGLKSG